VGAMRKFYYFFIKSGLPFLLLNMMILGGAKAIIRTNQNSLDYISLNINEAEISEKVKVDDIPTDPDYFWELIREDLDSGMRSNGNFPPIWDEPSITETIHGYIVPLSSYPRVNDIPLKYGDYIGGFYLLNGERKCGGARMWTGQENIILTLFGDDTSTPEKDGFSYGEVIEFRFFLQDTQKDYIVTTASYYVQTGYVTNGKWYPTSLSMFTNIKSSINLDFYIKFTENPVCVNNQIFFEAVEFIGNGGPYLYEWTSSIAGYYSNSPTPPPLTLEAPIELYLTVSSGNLTSSDQKTAKVNYHPIVDAGPDGQLCENGNYQLSATSLNSSSIEWTSSGDGVFNDPYLESAIYTPGVQDKITGTVNLTITAQPLAPCTATAYDEITLTIIHLPEVHAGEDMSTCGNQPVSLSAQVSNVGSLLWTTSGSGTFSDPNSSTTQYFPSSTDLSTGNNGIILILCAQAISPCNVNICDSINLSFNVAPTALGPTTIKRCEGVTFSLTGAVSNHSSILWTTQGDGTFSNPYVIPTQYTPGPQDIENSGTIVTLNALPIPPCDLPATKNINLYIQQKPRILSFGPDTNAMCATSAFLQLNAEVTGNNGVSWSYTGDGTLSSTNIVNPKYYPGTNDRQQGYFVLTLTAKPKSPCQVGTVESKTFYIQPNPTAFAGNDTIISEGVIYMTDEAIAENYSAIMWQTDGDGVFSNPENLHTSYIHGQLDVYNEFVELTLIAQPINPCAITASDVVILTIEISGCRDAKANAGIDKTICSNEHVCMNDASARHYVTLEWTSDGDGWFDYPNILKPCYYPGENDIFNGNVTLVLNAYAAEGCNNAADTVIIFINKAPTAIIESETVICQGESLSLSGLVQNSTGFQWYTTGDGYFINGQTLSPTYIHGGADLASGMVQICLKALANPGCEDVTECLMITIEHKPVVNAGADQTICENQTYTLNGTAQSYSTVQWQTNGSGTFNNPSILKPVYTPSAADKTAGSIVLTLTAQPVSPCTVSVSDQMTLTIQRHATANAGSDATICEDATYTLNGTAQRYSSVSWSTSGTGTFNNPSILKPVYTPSAADKTAGSVVLTLTAQPISPCAVSASDQMILTIKRLAVANAGSDATICEDATYTLNGTAQRYSSVSWSSSGTGTFNNPSILKPVYTPSAADKTAGSVALTLTAHPISPCVVSTSDQMILTIQRNATANAGSDATICEDATYTLNGTAQHYSSVSWSSSGTGTFNNPSILKPVYTPSAADKTAGSVVLTLTAQPISPCVVSTSDQMTLTIQRLATANAGSDATICEDATYTLNGTAQRYSSINWSSSGTGTFNNPSTLKPVYTPSAVDKTAGSVVLTLTAQPISPCTVSTSDQMTLTIQRLATANAGSDATICEDATYTLNGTAQHYSSVSWSSSGTGTFNNPSILKPVYTPSVADKTAGSVVLTLTAQPISPCTVSVSDQMTLTIQPLALVNAGDDATICAGQNYQLAGWAENYKSLIWTTSGDGSFDNSKILNPIYYPGQGDQGADSVMLCLTAEGLNGCNAVFDCMKITIQPLPIADAGENQAFCITGQIIVIGTSINSSSSMWISNGDGSFIEPTSLTTQYLPGTNDLANGFVDLCLTVTGLFDCGEHTDCITIYLIPEPIVNAGEDVTITKYQSYQTLNATAQNVQSLIWNTSGSGVFNDETTLHTIYSPSLEDISSGEVILTLTGFPLNPCQNVAIDSLKLTITYDCLDAITNAGDDEIVCEGESIQITSATAQFYESLLWSTDGDGSFDNLQVLDPIYTPGPNDLINGSLTLCLTAFANGDCLDDEDCINLQIQKLPTVYAGADKISLLDIICFDDAYAENYSLIQWFTTNGMGYFENDKVINACYIPSYYDIFMDSVYFTVTCFSLNPCTIAVEDQVVVKFFDGCFDATADAGEDMTACSDGGITISGTAENYNTVIWMTEGDGTFEDFTALETIYYPGENDIAEENVILSLTAFAFPGCNNATDYKHITLILPPTVNAGADQTICENQSALLQATAENYSSVQWQTNGSGTFNNPSILNPVYTPSATDKTAGSVVLTLTAQPISPCVVSTSDQMTLTIQRLATANAGSDATICEDATYTLNGTAQRYSSISWSSSGTGTFNNPSTLKPVYTPSAVDKTAGSVVLTLTAQPISPCDVSTSDQMTLTIQRLATANAGSDATICENQTHTLNGAAQSYSTVQWQTNGSGTFNNPSILKPVYTPSAADKTAGSVVLTLTAQSISPCTVSVSDQMTLTIQPLALVNAGDDATICAGQNYQLAGWAENYKSLIWTTSGDGSFDNSKILNPIYYPGQGDQGADSVMLCLTAEGLNGCNAVFDCMKITIQPLPIADAGENQAFCITGQIIVIGTSINSSSSMWISNGDGSFIEPTSLTTQYLPGTNDLANGFVDLCLTVTGLFDCGEHTDCITIYLIPEPIVNAGEDVTITKYQSYQTLNATAQNVQSLIWNTSGSGVFNDETTLHTIYSPSLEDINSGEVILTLTGFPLNPCQNVAIDSLKLTITYDCLDAIANAGDDEIVCEGESIQITSATAQFYESLLWSTDGDGSFDNLQVLDPIYTPGPNDLINGSLTLCLTAFANGDCLDDEDCINLQIQKLPTVYAGADKISLLDIICFDDAYAENYSLIQWFTTNGMGYFENDKVINACYIPSYYDIFMDSVYFTVTCFSLNPCTIAVEDQVVVKFFDGCFDATADAGEDMTACSDGGITISGTAENYNTVIWMTEGDGTFEDSTALETIYYPGENDIAEENVILSLTAFALPGCNNATDYKHITLILPPTVNAGPDVNICETSMYCSISGSASGYTQIEWETSGDGFFIPVNSLNTFYYPSYSDRENGGVVISLIAYSELCAPVSDQMELSIIKAPIVFAGNNSTICQDDSFTTLTAFASNYQQLQWSSSGDGIFESPDSLITIYYPGALDIQNGEATLNLNGLAIYPCANESSNMLLTILPNATADAGMDVSICENENVSLSASGTNYKKVEWQTTGDGTFKNKKSLTTIYYPGSQDKISGSVELTILAYSSNGCSNASSSLTVTIEKIPTVNAGADQTICENQSALLQATAENYSNVQWSTSGDGNFDNLNSLYTVYTPGNQDKENGGVTLTLLAMPVDLCATVSDQLILTFQSVPEVYAGNDVTVCENTLVSLQGEVVNSCYFTWQTSGDGAFENAESLITSYSPGLLDIESGKVTIWLAAQGCGPCEQIVKDSLDVTIKKLAFVDAGEDGIVCSDDIFILNQSAANNYKYIYWSTKGDGVFDNPLALHTYYIPGPEDIFTGQTELCLYAKPKSPCSLLSEDCLILQIFNSPVANAGENATICQSNSYLLQPTVSNADGIEWHSAGDGYFDNPNQPNATYYHGSGDASLGYVTLTLTAFGMESCGDISDELVLSINLPAEAIAGEDQVVCENDLVLLDGFASNFSSILWQTNGDGWFEDVNNLNTVYHPGQYDIILGEVTLCLKAFGLEGCLETIDCLEININQSPMVSAGNHTTICENDVVSLIGQSEHCSAIEWSSTGDGYFIDPANILTEYVPGQQDLINGFVEICLNGSGYSPCGQNSDCIMISFVRLPIVFAGDDTTIGKNDLFVTEFATASNVLTLLWSTSGSGLFDNPEVLVTTYTPSLEDIEDSEVILTLTAQPLTPCQIEATDELILKISYTCLDAVINSGGDGIVCLGDDFMISDAQGMYYSGLLWETTGDGSFNDITALNPIYTPGPQDEFYGTVTLCVTAYGLEDCLDATDCLVLTIQKPPVAFAGNSNIVPFPEEGGYTFTTAWAEHTELVQWITTNGMGIFDDENKINPTYQPSFLEIYYEYVTFGMVCSPINPCTVSDESFTNITFTLEGDDASVDINEEIIYFCENDTAIQINANGSYYSSVIWETTGDGYFRHGNSLSPIYVPGIIDSSGIEFTLTVTAVAFPDYQSATDQVIVSKILPPEIIAGTDMTVCGDEPISIENFYAENVDLVYWETSGDGDFTEPNNVITEYIAGQQDLINGYVVLTLYGINNNSICNYENASSSIIITFEWPVITTNIFDKDIKLGSPLELIIEANNAETIQWHGPNGIIEGTGSLILYINEATYEDEGDYYCVITNQCTTIYSDTAHITVYEEQVINLPADWSGISSWIQPFEPEIESIFADILDDLILIKNMTQMYSPVLNIVMLETWNPQEGYEIKTKSAVDVVFTGNRNLNTTIEIKHGWGYLPVISSCPVDVSSLFVGQQIEIIKEIGGMGTYWPQLGINTIVNLQPGRAYQIKAIEDFNITFPECEANKSGNNGSKVYEPFNPTSWNNPVRTPSTHVIAIGKDAFYQLKPGNVIGAFTGNGTCAGILQLTRNDEALVVFGKDPFTEVSDGFVSNEPINFYMFDPSCNETHSIEVVFDKSFPNHDGLFHFNGMSCISGIKSSTFIAYENLTSAINIYPNPTSGEVTIEGAQGKITVEVYQAGGLLLFKINEDNDNHKGRINFTLESYPAGIYYLRIISENVTDIRKIIRW
jgi:hypothetical protein